MHSLQNITAYKTDPAWLSWLALVEVETAAMAQSFTFPDSLVALDNLQLNHHKLYTEVKEYEGTEVSGARERESESKRD